MTEKDHAVVKRRHVLIKTAAFAKLFLFHTKNRCVFGFRVQFSISCCGNDVLSAKVRFRYKNHSVRVRKINVSQRENMQWCHAYKRLNAALNSGHWFASHVASILFTKNM